MRVGVTFPGPFSGGSALSLPESQQLLLALPTLGESSPTVLRGLSEPLFLQGVALIAHFHLSCLEAVLTALSLRHKVPHRGEKP